jgi:hypothetical protein
MSKTSIKRVAKARTTPRANRQPALPTKLPPPEVAQANTKPPSKQSRVVEMLRAPTGATIVT